METIQGCVSARGVKSLSVGHASPGSSLKDSKSSSPPIPYLQGNFRLQGDITAFALPSFLLRVTETRHIEWVTVHLGDATLMEMVSSLRRYFCPTRQYPLGAQIA
ncbi:hypothetical protein TGAM01_v205263 [Trichoderma gamsii]|uniref:Uncharacterized protein n=1 Tax=Trichoderma gamsii TaxID=398673 RepID=A0A2P4ZNI8_9HYPO|nr:hypothetical protein TGAM01_v205263 [Trichoderma gamsii]PON25826.1 hypothetical protein TGAM01_v205263 [Trichoderma gamsii]